jgi:3,4-dihydroxy 2-butanone 4-phosphate synthase/GTP cyclohydrolase II
MPDDVPPDPARTDGAPVGASGASGASGAAETATVTGPVADALAALRDGRIVVIVDEDTATADDAAYGAGCVGVFAAAAEGVSADTVNFMATHGRGLVSAPLPAGRLAELEIPPMVTDPAVGDTAFAVAVDHSSNSTGISAADRAATLRALVDPDARPSDFRRPGHTFPLRAVDGGVLRRAGHTEAALDLVVAAGCAPGAVTSEIIDAAGVMSGPEDLRAVAAEHGLPVVTIAEVIKFRRRSTRIVERVAEARIPTPFGEFRCVGYRSDLDGTEHVAFVRGDVATADDVLVRVHLERIVGDVMGFRPSDGRGQLEASLRRIAQEDCGVVVYFRRYDRPGTSIVGELRPPASSASSAPAMDDRDYGVGAQILADLGVRTMRLLTDSPVRRVAIEGHGLRVTGVEPLRRSPRSGIFAGLLDGFDDYGSHLLGIDAEPDAQRAVDSA